MPEDRKTIGNFTGAGVGGHASVIAFAKDEAGRLEVTVGGGPNPAIAVLDPQDTKHLVHALEKEFGKEDPHKDQPTSQKDKPLTSFAGVPPKASQPTEPERPIPGQPAKNPQGGIPAKPQPPVQK